MWLLQTKQLWLARADLLGDPWEIALAGNQLGYVIARHPVTTLPLPAVKPESAMQRSERIIKAWRQQTFVSCWSASPHESHALWRIYCHTSEGVAIQTTLSKLKESVGSLPVYRVTYEIPGTSKRTPTLPDLVTKKRLMFAYEQEVRVVLFGDDPSLTQVEREALGCRLDWEPEKYVESIRIHPEADCSFLETVKVATEHYAPKLKTHVEWSAMKFGPPF